MRVSLDRDEEQANHEPVRVVRRVHRIISTHGRTRPGMVKVGRLTRVTGPPFGVLLANAKPPANWIDRGLSSGGDGDAGGFQGNRILGVVPSILFR